MIIRKATSEDLPAVHQLIKELAAYEKEPDEVDTSVESLEEYSQGENPLIYIHVAERDGEIIGFALYYFAYSTWKGKSLYLEDFIINEQYRRQGIGKKLFESVIKVAKETNCRRMDWQVLEWNEQAITFYKKYNADLNGTWLNGRFYQDQLKKTEV